MTAANQSAGDAATEYHRWYLKLKTQEIYGMSL